MVESSFKLQYPDALHTLRSRIAEEPRHIQLLAGPRQVGKTTLLRELAAASGANALYVDCDAPAALLPDFWGSTWERVHASAAREATLLLLDEVQQVPRWSRLLKGEWDAARRRAARLTVVASGSSALRLGHGSKETLAGRFERIELVHWSAAALSRSFGVPPPEAAEILVREGAYPGAWPLRGDRSRWVAYVRDAILEPALGRDLLALEAVRKPALLRQVFAAALASPAQVLSLQKIQGQLHERGALETIAHYLALLEDAYLVAALPRYSPSLLRRRAAPPKLVVLSNAFLAAGDPRGAPERALDPARFGTWVENACLAHAWCAGQRVSYWREEPREVDAVLEGSWGSWAVEVKTGPFTPGDLKPLLELASRHRELRPLVLCDPMHAGAASRAGVPAMDWREFLASGLAAAPHSHSIVAGGFDEMS